MAQDPIKADAFQIEPGSGQTLLIDRDAATGSLKFTDAVATSGITLSALAGLQAVTNVLVVGKAGLGAQYTTIQSALNAIPSAASETNPYLVLVMPGQYDETINIVRNGVYLVGVGKVILRDALYATPDAPGADHTLIVSAQLGTTPQKVHVENLEIKNAHANKACVRLSGGAGSTVGASGIYIHNCDLHPDSAGGNRYLWATAVNNVIVSGGTWGAIGGGTLTEYLVIEEVAYLDVFNVANLVGALSLRYDDAQDEPAGTALSYRFRGCPGLGTATLLAPPVEVDVDGKGGVFFQECLLGNTTLNGSERVDFVNCIVGDLTVNETLGVSLTNTVRGTLNTNAGSVLDEPKKSGTASFVAGATAAVSFKIPMSDASYTVQMTPNARPANDETPWYTNKLATGFTINFNSAQTLDIDWRVERTDH